jgi:hypothetical protein
MKLFVCIFDGAYLLKHLLRRRSSVDHWITADLRIAIVDCVERLE